MRLFVRSFASNEGQITFQYKECNIIKAYYSVFKIVQRYMQQVGQKISQIFKTDDFILLDKTECTRVREMSRQISTEKGQGH